MAGVAHPGGGSGHDDSGLSNDGAARESPAAEEGDLIVSDDKLGGAFSSGLRVHVTPELVERATVKDSRHCMIAEAIQQQRPGWRNILVDLQTIRWTNPRTRKRYVALTPEVAAAALVSFDRGESIEPFSFSVRPIQRTEMKKTARGTKPTTTKRQLRISDDGQSIIEGGNPIAAGHLRGGGSKYHNRKASVAPSDEASNVVRSARRYRQYGLRLLRG